MEIKKRKMYWVGGNLVIGLPREVIRQFGLESGQEIDTYCHDNKLIVDLSTAGKPRPFVTPAEGVAA
jgi:hypothetical protein